MRPYLEALDGGPLDAELWLTVRDDRPSLRAMAQQIGDFLDGSPRLDQSCSEAVTQKVSTTPLNRDPGALESRKHNAGHGTAVGEGADRWNECEKDPTIRGPWARVKHVLGEGCAGLFEQWHDAVTMSLGLT